MESYGTLKFKVTAVAISPELAAAASEENDATAGATAVRADEGKTLRAKSVDVRESMAMLLISRRRFNDGSIQGGVDKEG